MKQSLKIFDTFLDKLEVVIEFLFKALFRGIVLFIFIVPGIALWLSFILPEKIIESDWYVILLFLNVFSLGASFLIPVLFLALCFAHVYSEIRKKIKKEIVK